MRRSFSLRDALPVCDTGAVTGTQAMPESLYLRPCGFLYGSAATGAVADGRAGRLAGGPIAFALLEVIEGKPGNARRKAVPWADIAASNEARIADLLGRMTAPRPSLGGLALDRPRVMGVVNVTPDSFSDGGLYDNAAAAIAQGAALAKAGADILDIGGKSTRPAPTRWRRARKPNASCRSSRV